MKRVNYLVCPTWPGTNSMHTRRLTFRVWRFTRVLLNVEATPSHSLIRVADPPYCLTANRNADEASHMYSVQSLSHFSSREAFSSSSSFTHALQGFDAEVL